VSAALLAIEDRRFRAPGSIRPGFPAAEGTARPRLDTELAAILADALVADFLDDRRRDGRNPEGNQP
jgi:hypothetical protein